MEEMEEVEKELMSVLMAVMEVTRSRGLRNL